MTAEPINADSGQVRTPYPPGERRSGTSVHATNGRIGALESWSRTVDRAARTKPGHSKSPASLDYHLAKVDPEGLMSEADRLKAAKNAHRAHMLRLAKASAAARRKKATA